MQSNYDEEKRSSAITLSDMELFIFPELIYSLVLANIMSPRIWLWRDDPWFAGLDKMKPYRRVARLKQFIMDHYAFNLDLDTWGLTNKEKEVARFSGFMDESTLAGSNALFGYEGDKYYFDIDIRTHFGLDKYEGNIIPYWKTETVEAMDAFKYKSNYTTGAGECVSLATLYAAALFIVARIPLKDIYLMATPLHSQNFIDIDDGVLTNNRRLVTKNMWFNGTAISSQARRALENERVAIVAHETGVIHAVYRKATIDRKVYEHFSERIKDYLKAGLTGELLGNFLRHDPGIQKCFQFRWLLNNVEHYIGIERVMEYERGCPYSLTDNTRDKLMAEVETQEFRQAPFPSRIILNDLEAFVKKNHININNPDGVARLREQFASDCMSADIAIAGLVRFCNVEPRLPVEAEKEFDSGQEPLCIDSDMSREEMIERLAAIRDTNDMAAMAFYAYRDLTRVEAGPFLKASLERNPVSIAGSEKMDVNAVVGHIKALPDESVYDEPGRLAQPDEVWNFGRGDGVEKALLLANIINARVGKPSLRIEVAPDRAVLKTADQEYVFASSKRIVAAEWVL